MSKAFKNKRDCINIGGYTFKSDRDLSLQLGKCDHYVSVLRRQGKSYKEIIKKAKPGPVKIVYGYTFRNNRDLSRQLGKYDNYVGRLRRKGKSYKDIISQAIKQPQTVLGYSFLTDKDLSRQLGKCDCYVNALRRQGKNYEEIIEQALYGPKVEEKTVLGYTFKNDADLSRQLGKCDRYVGHLRRQEEKNYEEIIEQALYGPKIEGKTVLGYTFKNDTDLSRQLGKSDSYVSRLHREGRSYKTIIKQALKNDEAERKL